MPYSKGATEGGTVVLLAESHEKNLKTLRQALENLGILERLVVVSNGVEALAYLRGDGKYADRLSHPFPSFVFLNSRLPVLSGIAVLCCLRSEGRFERLPVVMFGKAFTQAQSETARWLRAACCTQRSLPGQVMQAMAQSVRLALPCETGSERLPLPVLA